MTQVRKLCLFRVLSLIAHVFGSFRPRFLGGGGCNDAFSAFAFLTFLLTLLDVILGKINV